MGDMVAVVLDAETDVSSEKSVPGAGDLLSQAHRDFRLVADTEAVMRQNFLDDKLFAASEQWDLQSINDRDTEQRPRLTINRLRQFIRQVTNNIREANLAVKVIPIDNNADIDTAEVFQGIIQHIETQSDAQTAYETAAEDQATCGRGYWRIVSEYTDERSFTQDLKIKRVRNSFLVYMDPAHTEADGSDARFCFVVEDVPKNEYRQRFPDSQMSSLTDFQSIGDQQPDWMPEGKVRIAEYWYVDVTSDTLLMVEVLNPITGETEQFSLFQDEYDTMPAILKDASVVLQSRAVDRRQVKMALINGVEILEGNDDKTAGRDWPGKWIPIVPVIGEEIDINGRLDLRGMVRDAKDPQRLYNFENTALAETLALAPLTQWVGYEGQFEGHETKWVQANRRRFPYLEAKPISLDGNIVPLPQRITSEPPINAITIAIRQADNDLQATMGLFQESLGQRASANQSGKAITALQKQGEISNSNFMSNLARSIRFTGRILVDLIPHFYDAPRVLRILGVDDQPMQVMVHANASPSALPPDGTRPPGIQGIYNLGAGRYDVTVDVGPSHASKRQEAAEQLSNFVQAYPNAFPVLGDLIMGNMDWPGAQAAAARLKKMVPPQFLDDGQGGQPQLPPEIQQQLQQLQQQNQMLVQENQALNDKFRVEALKSETQIAIQRLKAEMEERLKLLDVQSKIAMAEAVGKSDLVQSIGLAESQRIDKMLDQDHERQMQSADNAHEAALAAATHATSQPPAGAAPLGPGGAAPEAPTPSPSPSATPPNPSSTEPSGA